MKDINLNRRQFSSTIAALGTAGWALPATAQTAFPSKTVRLYVGSSAGGAPDAAARTMSRLLAESWKQSVVVENKPGTSGLLAAEATVQAAPDGHSFCMLLDTVLNTVPHLSENIAFDPVKELKPIGMVGSFPLVLVANAGQPYRNLAQLVSAAKANPGSITIGSSGLGSSGHVATETFSRAAGLKLNHIPYKGGLPALNDTAAGHIATMWSSVGAAIPFINSGKLVPMAIASGERFSLLPNALTFNEQGFPGFSAGNWLGLMGPAALPDAIAQKIYADILALGANDAYRQTLLGQGIEFRNMRGGELAQLIRTESDRNKALFTSLGLTRSK